MCDECGVNSLSDGSFDLDAFLDSLLGPAVEPQDFMEEYRTSADVTLTGEDWKVAVAKQGGTSDVNQAYEPGEQWIINVYEENALTDSMVVDAVSAKTTQQVANEFAGHLFGYEV